MTSNDLAIQPIVVTSKVTIPLSETATGTFDTQGTGVIGDGTKFKTEMPMGSYIYDSSNNELRKVIRVDSDELAWIDKAFSGDLSSAQDIIPSKKCKAKAYIFTCKDVNGRMVDNSGTMLNQFIQNIPVTISKLGNDRSSGRDLLPPTIVDSVEMYVQIIY